MLSCHPKEQEQIDFEKVQAVLFYPRKVPTEPLEWKALENRLKPSIKEPPKVELKELPDNLQYAFLQKDDQLPVVISLSYSTQEMTKLLEDFDKLKQELTQAPVMIKPDWSLPFKIMCNASDYAVGVILGQRRDKPFQPIHFASKTIDEAQENYTTTENELLAVVFTFDKFRQYLRLSKTIIFTNHSVLRWKGNQENDKIESKPDKNGKLETPDNLFTAPFNIKITESFMNRVGYQGVVDKKKDVIQYPRFIKLIIADLMKKFPDISLRFEEDYHSIKDDISLEEIEKMVEDEEDDESYASEFADSMLNDDVYDSSTRIEPESHKENPMVVDDDDVNDKQKQDEPKDDNVETMDDVAKENDNDDQTDHTLARTYATGSMVTRNEQTKTPIPTPT
nr:hypothetical protein [Tanacetum cinerariifolium]